MGFQRRRDEAPAAVADRIFAILDAFTVSHPEMTLSEISLNSGLPLSTTLRLLAKLSEWGALERQEDRRYRIGWRLSHLATLSFPPAAQILTSDERPSTRDVLSRQITG